MTEMERAFGVLMGALISLKPGLRKFDQTRSLEDNVEITGVEKKFVHYYDLGLRAAGPPIKRVAQVDRDTAEKLMACYEQVGKALNDVTIVIATIPDADEQKKLRYPLGQM